MFNVVICYFHRNIQPENIIPNKMFIHRRVGIIVYFLTYLFGNKLKEFQYSVWLKIE